MMKQPVIDEVVARKFLLGQLSPEDQGEIEELAFEDPDTFTFLESVEKDLIDEYVHDELSPFEKQRFEDYFLSFPGRRQELAISEVLQKHFDSEAEPVDAEQDKGVTHDDDRKFFLVRFLHWWKQSSFQARAVTAAVLFAFLIIVVWIISQDEKQPDPIQAGPGTPVTVPSPEPHISPSLQPSPSPVHANNKPRSSTPEEQKPVVAYGALLMPSAKPRSAPGQPLQLPPDASSVSLGLALTDPKTYKTYDATLVNEAGTKIDQWSNLEEQRLAATGGFRETRGLLIPVKTSLLKPDENYRIEVTGVSSKGERSPLQGYSFQAKK